jgi:hypothetical protein
MQEWARKTQEDNSSWSTEARIYSKKSVPENICIEVGSAADKIKDRPVFII